MRITPDFSEFRSAVEHVSASCHVALAADFRSIIRDELAAIPGRSQLKKPDEVQLQKLYEVRSQYLDWELGTGYLGMFAHCPGTRYTFTRRIEEMFRMLPDIQPEFRILEIGCGAGLVCLKIAPFARLIVGIDVSQSALNFANRIKVQHGCANVIFQKTSAERLAFRDHVFDLVVCGEVLEHLSHPEQALSEMRRVTKDSGQVILSTPAALSFSDLCMTVLRQCTPRIETEKSVHFDKRTYLAVARIQQNRQQAASAEAPAASAFVRIHTRFRYQTLIRMLRQSGFAIEAGAGAVFAFPPHYQLVYRLCPRWLLRVTRYLEQFLNRIHVFQRFGAMTTCFHLKPL